MQKLEIPQNSRFIDLKLDEFNSLKYAVYVINDQWDYLFVNDYARRNLGERGNDLVGKNMWKQFEELESDPAFARMRAEIEKGLPINITTTSPISNQRLNIVGYPLQDCYFFYASQLPKKDELLNELRSTLSKN
jgi:PAS domain-containing protein